VSGKGVGSRGRGAVLGAALGASIGVPAGMLQDYLVTLLPEDQQRERQKRVQQTESIIAGEGKAINRQRRIFYFYRFIYSFTNILIFCMFFPAVPLERPETPPEYDPAGAVIQQLEASLASSPSGGGAGEKASSAKKGGAGWKLWGRTKESSTTE
jgi:hypothetical protein